MNKKLTLMIRDTKGANLVEYIILVGVIALIAIAGEWVEQLYLDPQWTDRGIGSSLLLRATADMPAVRLHCFQANSGARRFYERHGFRAEAFRDGSGNEEGLPDIVYVRSNRPATSRPSGALLPRR